MPVYTFTALTADGVPRSGEVAAESEPALRAELAARGLLVERVRQRHLRLRPGRKSVRIEDVMLFNQEFLALTRAGLTVPDALSLASDRPDSPALAKVVRKVLQDIRDGARLSEACARYPEVFDRLYLAALRTGERTGDLAGVLARQQAYLRHRVSLRKRVGQAITYPLFLLGALLVIVSVLFVFVMPRFVAMYADLDSDLPAPTQVLIGFVERLHVIAPVSAVVLAAAFVSWRRWTASEAGRRRFHRQLHRVPYIGELIRSRTTSPGVCSRSPTPRRVWTFLLLRSPVTRTIFSEGCARRRCRTASV